MGQMHACSVFLAIANECSLPNDLALILYQKTQNLGRGVYMSPHPVLQPCPVLLARPAATVPTRYHDVPAIFVCYLDSPGVLFRILRLQPANRWTCLNQKVFALLMRSSTKELSYSLTEMTMTDLGHYIEQ
jgi:hypothetical protein